MHPFLHAAALTFLVVPSWATAPQSVKWNTTHSYGPDGPWQVISVDVGTDKSGSPLSTLNLSPGGIYEHMIPAQQYCQGVSPICFAASAGLYDINNSITAVNRNPLGLVWEWNSSSAINTTGTAHQMSDTISMNTAQGTAKVPNSTIFAIWRQDIFLPDFGSYQIQLGSLSLGAPTIGIENFGQTFPSYLAMQNATPSNSFSLHYGSASLGPAGSLVWGGYDQSRVLGDVGSFPLTQPGKLMMPTLLDVQLGVENGQSPFVNGSSFPGLLELNSTLNNVQPTVINPIVPYLFMSPTTCAAIARQLPVALNPDIGLYMWNVADQQFQRVMSSSAYLAFVFQSSPDTNITIKVPFQLLNLTLEPPIVGYPQQYFPCRPFYSMDGTGNYFLGKAFLQAAFIGINWDTENFFMAQGPGPGAPSPTLQSIKPSDTSVASIPVANFASSWSKTWTLLADQPNGTAIRPSTDPTASPHESSSQPLSTGAKIGIGFGSAIGFITILAAAIIAMKYRQRLEARRQSLATLTPRSHELNGRDADGLHEMHPRCLLHEKDASKEYHEKQSNDVYELRADGPTHVST